MDAIRPPTWPDLQGEQLLNLISLIEQTMALEDKGKELLGRVMSSPLILASDLPKPSDLERRPLTDEDSDDVLDEEPEEDEEAEEQSEDGVLV
ncbi:hypothetical protein D9M69_685250 [compost metagenome]